MLLFGVEVEEGLDINFLPLGVNGFEFEVVELIEFTELNLDLG